MSYNYDVEILNNNNYNDGIDVDNEKPDKSG